MQSNKKILELKNALPLGSYIEISDRTGINIRTIANLFDGKKCRLKTTMVVIKEAEKLLAEYNEVIGVSNEKPETNEKN